LICWLVHPVVHRVRTLCETLNEEERKKDREKKRLARAHGGAQARVGERIDQLTAAPVLLHVEGHVAAEVGASVVLARIVLALAPVAARQLVAANFGGDGLAQALREGTVERESSAAARGKHAQLVLLCSTNRHPRPP
jgi:hypothetical protein